ncbi:hypothetical protein K1719_039915 [Acacia pycnantha]|nr:hypothetical protein K1719_039915 [Acacia pycnantha]
MDRIVEWKGRDVIGERVLSKKINNWQAASEWLYVYPWKALNYLAQRYNHPIYVTENGMEDENNDEVPLNEMLDDKLRVRYFKEYLAAVASAINVQGWSGCERIL